MEALSSKRKKISLSKSNTNIATKRQELSRPKLDSSIDPLPLLASSSSITTLNQKRKSITKLPNIKKTSLSSKSMNNLSSKHLSIKETPSNSLHPQHSILKSKSLVNITDDIVKPKKKGRNSDALLKLATAHTASSLAKINSKPISNSVSFANLESNEQISPKVLSSNTSIESTKTEETLIIKFPATIHQQSLYNYIVPPIESGSLHRQNAGTDHLHHITQGYSLQIPNDVFSKYGTKLIRLVVQRIRSENPVLRSYFDRNDRILDADVEGYIDNRYQFKSIANESEPYLLDSDEIATKYFEVLTTSEDENFADIYNHVSQELALVKNLKNLFKTFVFVTKTENKITLVVSLSTLIGDEFSCTWIAHEIQILLNSAIIEIQGGNNDILNLKCIKSYESGDKRFDYIDLAFHVHRLTEKNPMVVTLALNTLKAQLTEQVHPNEDADTIAIRKRIKSLTPQVDAWKQQMKKLEKEYNQIDTELSRCTEQRKNIDLQENNSENGDVISYYDSLTGEMIYIPPKAKASLIAAVLETSNDDDSVLSILKRHDVSDGAISRLTEDQLRITNFIQLSPETFDLMILSAKDRTKLKALVDFVRVRLRDAFAEQTKIKFALERKIQKLIREKHNLKEAIAQAESLFEENESEKIILEQTLSPEIQIIKLPIASIPMPEIGWTSQASLNSEKKQAPHYPLPRALGTNFHASRFVSYGFCPIKIEPSLYESIDLISKSWERFVQTPVDFAINKSSSSKGHAIHITFLAAFSIMLKHWMGYDKFVLAHRFSTRKHQIDSQKTETAPLIGPLSPLIPLKIDVSNPNMTFAALYSKLNIEYTNIHDDLIYTPKDAFSRGMQGLVSASVLRSNAAVGMTVYRETALERVMKSLTSTDMLNDTVDSQASLNTVDSTANNSLNFPIQMEFFEHVSWNDVFKKGIDWKALAANGETETTFKQLWSIDTDEPFDLKLIIVEQNGSVHAGFRYRKDIIDEATIEKWSERLANILFEIEDGGKTYTISKLISRFYNTVLSTVSLNNINK